MLLGPIDQSFCRAVDRATFRFAVVSTNGDCPNLIFTGAKNFLNEKLAYICVVRN